MTELLDPAFIAEAKALQRYVRTTEGARFYGQPVGSVIVPDADRPPQIDTGTRWLYLDHETVAARQARAALQTGTIPRGYRDVQHYAKALVRAFKDDRETRNMREVRRGRYAIKFNITKAKPEEIRDLTDWIDQLIEAYPDPEPIVGYGTQRGEAKEYVIDLRERMVTGPAALGETYPGGWEMHLKYDALRSVDGSVYGEMMMPSFDASNPMPFVVAHEWAHILAHYQLRQSPEYREVYRRNRKHLSRYAQDAKNGPDEGFGEAFAEWVVTDGMSGNPGVQDYAATFGWRRPSEVGM